MCSARIRSLFAGHDPRTWVLSLFVSVIAVTSVAAHQVEHEIVQSTAAVIVLRYADGTPFAFEECEVRRIDTDSVLLVGRTDVHGRLAFVPPVSGRYAVRARSEDGHGANFEFETAALSTSMDVEVGAGGRSRGALQIATGVAVILALFAGLRLFQRRTAKGSDR